MENAFRDGAIRTTGTDIDKILPAMSRFGGGNRQDKKKTVIEKLKVFFEKYFGSNKNKNYFFVALARKKRDYILKNVRKMPWLHLATKVRYYSE